MTLIMKNSPPEETCRLLTCISHSCHSRPSFCSLASILALQPRIPLSLSLNSFSPEIIGYIFSKSMFIWVFEAAIQKGVFYFLNIANPPFLELLAYTGYKFVALCILVLCQMVLGSLASLIALGVIGALYALFFFQTLRRFSSANTLADHIKEVSMNRKSFMLVNSCVQIALIWLLNFN